MASAALESLEESESLTRPTEESIGFENQEGWLPSWKLAREEQGGETVPSSQAGFLEVAVEAQRNELLAEEGVLEQELRFGAAQIERGADGDGGLRLPAYCRV